MSTATVAATAATSTTIASPSTPATLPGASYFRFVNVDELHHRLQSTVNHRIEQLKAADPARDIYIASRSQLCGKPANAQLLIEALRRLDVPLLLLINEQYYSAEVIDLHECGHESKIRSCGKRSH